MQKTLSIVGGEFKQRCIYCPQQTIRPVMAKVRNSVFQKIFNYIHANSLSFSMELTFLDLFSGSGLMSIEAVSRGFLYATAVEKDSKKWHIITQNFKIRPTSFVLKRMSAELFIVKHNVCFDVLYLDPPFVYKYKKDLLYKVCHSRICHPKSLVILHVPSHETEEILSYVDTYLTLQCIDKKVFGGSTVLFFCM